MLLKFKLAMRLVLRSTKGGTVIRCSNVLVKRKPRTSLFLSLPLSATFIARIRSPKVLKGGNCPPRHKGDHHLVARNNVSWDAPLTDNYPARSNDQTLYFAAKRGSDNSATAISNISDSSTRSTYLGRSYGGFPSNRPTLK
jgi:hypothetical protein